MKNYRSFKCGTIGHLERECNLLRITLPNQYDVQFPVFGDWLKTDYNREPLDIYEQGARSWFFPPESPDSVGVASSEVPTFATQAVHDDGKRGPLLD